MKWALKLARRMNASRKEKLSFVDDLRSFQELARLDSRFTAGDVSENPMLYDKNAAVPFDRHYFFHPAWAARVLAEKRPSKHIDISSILHFAGVISAFIPTEYYEYQPPELGLSDLPTRHVDLLDLPFSEHSVPSLSCMHVVEHIGLGRYGDPINPTGDLAAAAELERVVAPGGLLLFVVPIANKPRIEFNAHRVYTYDMVLEMFPRMRLVEFALIPDNPWVVGSQLVRHAAPDLCKSQDYGCGCFYLTKAGRHEDDS